MTRQDGRTGGHKIIAGETTRGTGAPGDTVVSLVGHLIGRVPVSSKIF